MRIIPLAGEAEPMLSPDLVWDGIMGDLALAEPSEVQNRGGLRARAQLETAVLICLMSDARAAAEELRDGDTNRGWPGDTFDLDTAAGEAPIGSRLWLLERSTVDAVETPRRAEDYARAALQPLLDQGAAAAVTARAEADPARNRLTLAVTLTDRAGGVLVSRRFSLLWERLAGISVPYAPVAPEEDAVEPLPPVAPPLFGASLPAGVLLGDEPDGFALDFTRNSGLIRSSSDKSLQKSGTIADLCTFTRATAATYFDRNGILRTAGPNVLRLTHDPATGKALGYLAEAQATNLCLRSQDQTHTAWVKASLIAAIDAVGIDGTLSACTLTSTGPCYSRQQFTVTPGAVLTWSFYAKKGTSTDPKYRIYNATAGADIVTGTDYSGQINPNSFRRISVTFTVPAGCTSIYCYVQNGNNAGTVIIDACQLETGAYPTSYIPTTTAAVTRAADSMSVNTAKIPPISGTCSIVAKAIAQDAASTTILRLDAGASDIVTNIRNSGSGSLQRVAFAGTGTAQGNVTLPVRPSKGQPMVEVMSVATNNLIGATLQGPYTPDTVVDVYGGNFTRIFVGCAATNGAEAWGQPIAAIAVIPRAISQSECNARAVL